MYSLRIEGAGLPVASLTEAEAAAFVARFEPSAPEGAEYCVSARAVESLTADDAPAGLVTALQVALDGRAEVTVTLEQGPWDDALPGGEVEVAGRLLSCLVCHGGRFEHRKAQLHSRLATLFNLEWLGPTTDCFVCVECGYIHWFHRR